MCAFDDKDLYIFQARPITSTIVLKNYAKYRKSLNLNKIKSEISHLLESKKHISGDTTILGDMPDWNPAELIGSKPRPLAFTLFDYLITKNVWRLARKDLGYFNPEPERFMVVLGGHPYVDVRNSLNSLTPDNMKKELREKIVNESLYFLSQNPDSHDKLEFEVATTCFSPLCDKMVPRWKDFGLAKSEIDEILTSYRKHTNHILQGNYIEKFLDQVKNLDDRRKAALNYRGVSNVSMLNFLIDDCANLGTRPFSSLARLAFIGNSFLKSFLSDGVITMNSYNNFLNSISTVATDMSKKIERVLMGKIEIEEYLEEYGHLRPGTWDIRSHTYAENPKIYFDMETPSNVVESKSHVSIERFVFGDNEKLEIQKVLDSINLQTDADNLLDFIEKSIEAREYAKFVFSRNISDILSIITDIGQKHGFSRSDLSFIDIQTFLDCNLPKDDMDLINLFRKKIEVNKNEYLRNQQVIMPQLIMNEVDIEIINFFRSRANYITTQKVLGEVVDIDEINSSVSIDNKIVMIESADPGYDWIFTHKIKGLITKYGGAASHMAIRSSEFNLPAAIGVGSDYEIFKKGKRVVLDCENRRITVS